MLIMLHISGVVRGGVLPAGLAAAGGEVVPRGGVSGAAARRHVAAPGAGAAGAGRAAVGRRRRRRRAAAAAARARVAAAALIRARAGRRRWAPRKPRPAPAAALAHRALCRRCRLPPGPGAAAGRRRDVAACAAELPRCHASVILALFTALGVFRTCRFRRARTGNLSARRKLYRRRCVAE